MSDKRKGTLWQVFCETRADLVSKVLTQKPGITRRQARKIVQRTMGERPALRERS